mmetsp:Transcript_4168/g.8296  ORF Transcript_4168/g.8296 Transcript_4168/m.8296 type:complete len:277 (+) Transcript_4168:356-1186(+)
MQMLQDETPDLEDLKLLEKEDLLTHITSILTVNRIWKALKELAPERHEAREQKKKADEEKARTAGSVMEIRISDSRGRTDMTIEADFVYPYVKKAGVKTVRIKTHSGHRFPSFKRYLARKLGIDFYSLHAEMSDRESLMISKPKGWERRYNEACTEVKFTNVPDQATMKNLRDRKLRIINFPKSVKHCYFSCKTPTGTLQFEATPEETVLQAKYRIYRMEGIAPDQQRLLFAGKQLKESRTLEECGYKLTGGSVQTKRWLQHLVLKVVGPTSLPAA